MYYAVGFVDRQYRLGSDWMKCRGEGLVENNGFHIVLIARLIGKGYYTSSAN